MYIKDPLANLKLTEDDYYWITEEIVKIAKQSCAGRIVSTLEGEYVLYQYWANVFSTVTVGSWLYISTEFLKVGVSVGILNSFMICVE